MFAEREDDENMEVEDLLRLARDRSAAARSQLVDIVSDLFFNTSRVLSERERDTIWDILRQLIQDVEISVRKHLAIRLSDEPEAPAELVTALDNDTAKIAQETMSYLVEQSQRVDSFRNPLVRRQDLPEPLAKQMALWVSAALRTKSWKP